MSVKRYESLADGYGTGMDEHPDGEWARWEDYEAMKAARDAWREESNQRFSNRTDRTGEVRAAALDAKAGA